jgi:hypothetical protein
MGARQRRPLPFAAGNERAALLEWSRALSEWMIGPAPLALGLLLLASSLALLGYGVVRFAWRVHLVRRWRQRQDRTCR